MKKNCLISITVLCVISSVVLLSSMEISAQGNGQYHSFDLNIDGLTRQYTLYVPEGYDGIEEWPVVLHLHGFTLSIDDLIRYTQLCLVADTAKFLIVYPQGLNVGTIFEMGWNYPCPDFSHPQDDVAFISRIIGDLNANPDFAIDLDRIHVSGWSMGGEMAFYLACALSDRIASVAGISAQMPQQVLRTHDTWEPLRPISVLHMEGTNDEYYPEKGNGCLPLKGVTEFWSEVNGCNAIPDSTAIDDINKDDSTTVTLFNYGSCNDGFEVLLYRVEGGVHEWPGGAFDEIYPGFNRDINASAELWNFFKRNPRPSASMMVEIPDTAFLYALIDEGVDSNGDSLISYAEAETVKSLNVSRFHKVIRDLTGIEAFFYLDSLDCSNNKLTNLNVSNNTVLQFLDCNQNVLTNLDLSGLTSLKYLKCAWNQLTSLDVSDLKSLETLFCKGNQLTSLDLSNCINLQSLNTGSPGALGTMYSNPLIELNVSGLTSLTTLYCSGHEFTSLDVSGCTALEVIICYSNNLTSLDVSGLTSLTTLYCNDNQLTSLDISTNLALQHLVLSSMPSLHEVCVWTIPFPPDTVDIDTTGSPNVCFQTDCNGDCSIVGVGETCSQEVTIYPNPNVDLLHIETVSSGHYSINITSLNGQIVLSKEFEGNSQQIDLSTFQKGVYFITVRSMDFTTTKKIIKL